MSYLALLLCPDEKTARIVSQVLHELDFAVEPAEEPFAAVKKLMAQHFDAVVVDCDNEQNAALLFKSARNSTLNQSALAVAVVEGQAGVAKAFRIGANLVLTRPINIEQSKSTLRVARGLLRKTDSVKPAGAIAPPLVPAVRSVPAASDPVRPATPAGAAAKPALAPPVPPRPAPTAKPVAFAEASGFEVEDDPLPQPDAAEAALLDSMPLPAVPTRPVMPAATAIAKKASPVSEPAPGAIRRAAEVAAKSAADDLFEPSMPAASPELAPAGPARALRLGVAAKPSEFSGRAAAASAPAPAKEAPPSEPRTLSLEFKQPAGATVAQKSKAAPLAVNKLSITDLAEAEPEAPPEEPPARPETRTDGRRNPGKKNRTSPLVLILLLLALAAAGYYGYATFTGQPVLPFLNRQSVPQAAPGKPVSTPAATPDPGSTPPLTQSLPAAPATSQPQPGAATPAATTDQQLAGDGVSESAATPDMADAPAPAKPSPVPLEVKPGLPPTQKTASREDREPAPAPSVLVASGGGDKAIAGIVGATHVALPSPSPQTVQVSQGVSQGLLVKRVQPIYPAQALEMHLAGQVLIDAIIAKDGNITGVKQVTGNPTLGRAALEAVRQWKYRPYLLNGQPVEIETQIVVNFNLPR